MVTGLRTLLPMACDGVGPSFTCTQLLGGMARRGLQGPLYVSRTRKRLDGLDYRSAMPGPLAYLPYRFYGARAGALAERRFLSELREDEVAYLWPTVSLRTFEEVRSRGNPIVAEGINTRMARAREVLDAAYASAGLAPGHNITDARIREEDEKLALTTAIFAPSAGVARSLSDAPIARERILETSYGTLPVVEPLHRDRGRRDSSGRLTVLFVGFGCIRKGLHQLLRAWSAAEIGARLVLAGEIEPALRDLCSDELGRRDVTALGFVRDVASLYATADVLVLPSFEEGDPLVTYEAAAHGLAVIASPMGAGRIGEETGSVLLVDPSEPASIVAALRRLAADPEELAECRRRSREAVRSYWWPDVGARRADLLRAAVDEHPPQAVHSSRSPSYLQAP